MKSRVHGLRCSAMREAHAKCVKIYRRRVPVDRFSRAFCGKSSMAPTLLLRLKAHGRNQPFDPGNMNVTEAVAAKLCPASVDREACLCTEPGRRLHIRFEPCSFFQLHITSVLDETRAPYGLVQVRRYPLCFNLPAVGVALPTEYSVGPKRFPLSGNSWGLS